MNVTDLLSHNGEIAREGTILWDIWNSTFYIITYINDKNFEYFLQPQHTDDPKLTLSLNKDEVISRFNIVQIATHWNP